MVKAAAVGTFGVAVALLWAPAAMADTEIPVDPPPPLAVVEAAPAADPLIAVPAAAVPLVAPATDAVPVTVTPADGVPHLATPDNLPPGTTQQQTRNSTTRGYLKDVWEAVRSGDVTGGEALLLIAQRPMNTTSALQDMTPQQAIGPAGALAPAGAVPPAADAVPPAADAVPPAADAVLPAADAVPAAEAPLSDPALSDPAPPLPLTLAP